jgi:hypothetical protein
VRGRPGLRFLLPSYFWAISFRCRASKVSGVTIVTRERVRGLNEDREKLLQIIAGRGKDPIIEVVPGGGTGHLIHQERAFGQGDNNEIIDEFVFDAALYHACGWAWPNSYREIEKASENVYNFVWQKSSSQVPLNRRAGRIWWCSAW